MRPLLPGAAALLGNNGIEMEHDEVTPPCVVCGKPHVGMHSIAFIMLRGSYMFLPEHAVEVFAIDPDIPLQPMQLQDSSFAVAVGINERKKNAFVMHEECAEAIAKAIAAFVQEQEID